jgi:regulator of replication initiation timing
MARPKKAAVSDMLRIVNAYWETHGDPKKLKCSLLEEYAAAIGYDIKAYDFRRDEAVRKRIEELKKGGGLGTVALAYKNLDADALIANNVTKPTLKAALLDLDSYWRDIYDHSVEIAESNLRLLLENAALRKSVAGITAERDENDKFRRINNALAIENRYLRSALSRYLYPAIANEILHHSGVLKQIDTEVTDIAMADMSESSTPMTFSAAIAPDAQILSREQALIERMKQQIEQRGQV